TEARRRERITRQQVREESKLRYLWMGWDDDKRVLHVEADVPGEQGAAFEAKLRRRSEEIVVEDGVMDREGARLCDALVELVCEGGGSGNDVVVVHADVAALTGTTGEEPRLAETETGIRLADETVRRLACDAVVDWVVEAGGVPVGLGRRSRTIPPRVQRLLRHRDRGCRFPGCGRERWLKAHHIWHW